MSDENCNSEAMEASIEDLSFEPAITNEQCQTIGGNWNDFGVDFRIALVLLTKTQDELVSMVTKDPETSVDIFDHTENAIKTFKTGMELVSSAQTRLMWAFHAAGFIDEEEATA